MFYLPPRNAWRVVASGQLDLGRWATWKAPALAAALGRYQLEVLEG